MLIKITTTITSEICTLRKDYPAQDDSVKSFGCLAVSKCEPSYNRQIRQAFSTSNFTIPRIVERKERSDEDWRKIQPVKSGLKVGSARASLVEHSLSPREISNTGILAFPDGSGYNVVSYNAVGLGLSDTAFSRFDEARFPGEVACDPAMIGDEQTS
ncbi:hypothetical protein GLAREA_00430 [Glarea lozoyensis ATCC 20868]|uniref:Uncharacterized protein n=1 Tax=Glarea lozoyensis (strain ATCC 20868 / MF5171) TaxID=1116229 RepID=S3CUI0_GLAL2|nr:uncharacterized protein GLAREA_00430 [Glarea lozoyensis ATCC 20868]EPE29270.1 hypothetical protein GLAREA_00430 [Glarea lozoyensis ATCC 20868]